MHHLVVVLTLVSLFVGVPCLVAAGPAAELAARVQARYRQITAIQADYTRESRFTAIAGQAARTVKGSGTLIFARPLSLRLVQVKPRRELVVTTGDVVWWSRPKKKRAELFPLQSFTTGLRPLLDALSGLSQVGESFVISAPGQKEAGLGGEGAVLVLTPKETRADLKKLILWFDGESLVLAGFRIINLVGDVTDYRLRNLKINPDLPDDTFSYQLPQGYRLRDHRPVDMRK